MTEFERLVDELIQEVHDANNPAFEKGADVAAARAALIEYAGGCLANPAAVGELVEAVERVLSECDGCMGGGDCSYCAPLRTALAACKGGE